MKVSKIIKQYNLPEDPFLKYLIKDSNINVEYRLLGGYEIPDDTNVDELIKNYNKYKEKQKQIIEKKKGAIAEKKAKEEQELMEKQKSMAQMLITSGFQFDGYTITKYSGYISGDDVIQVNRGYAGVFSSATDVGSSLTNALVKIRRQALLELKEAAYALGCNAVIGVDFDYITLEPETANFQGGTTYLPYVFCVTANGNAVVIEKNKC